MSKSKRVPISLKLEPEIIAYFKGTGVGWVDRLNKMLLKGISQVNEEETCEADKPEFKVGQVWLTRDGRERTISRVDDFGDYPIFVEEPLVGCTSEVFDLQGRWQMDKLSHPFDLVELVDGVGKRSNNFSCASIGIILALCAVFVVISLVILVY